MFVNGCTRLPEMNILLAGIVTQSRIKFHFSALSLQNTRWMTRYGLCHKGCFTYDVACNLCRNGATENYETGYTKYYLALAPMDIEVDTFGLCFGRKLIA